MMQCLGFFDYCYVQVVYGVGEGVGCQFQVVVVVVGFDYGEYSGVVGQCFGVVCVIGQGSGVDFQKGIVYVCLFVVGVLLIVFWCQVVEVQVFVLECYVYGIDGIVLLFVDDYFVDVFFGGVLVIDFILVQEYDYVGVLFDGFGFLQVGYYWMFVGLLFQGVVEL